jgi:hypothetical protein
LDDFTAQQPGVTETDGREGPIADDQPVRANPPINAGVKLVGAARVVRVDQDQFHVPLRNQTVLQFAHHEEAYGTIGTRQQR